ncbi:MAG: PHP domain-containing protein [Clostridiales Family XIII bacterium]|nr:PHP domain-containing protein [Clostridiales Family XIII bacterium]
MDLHLHTNRSDGACSPSDVMRLAFGSGLRLCSVTDHDTTDGIDESRSAADALGIAFIPGIEISTQAEHEQHILGYFIDRDDPEMKKMCERLMALRNERIDRTLAFLNCQGVRLTREEVAAQAPGPYLGRPHIAAAMVRAGYVPATRDAFQRYLASEAYFKTPRPKPGAEEAIMAIRAAGGAAVLAHPDSLRMDGRALDRHIASLRAMGLAGIECYYGTYDASARAGYLRLAEKHDLVVTGGSDFHGEAVKPGIRIGTGKDGLLDFDDLGVCERLKAVAGRDRAFILKILKSDISRFA